MKPATALPWTLGKVNHQGDSILADGKTTFCDMQYYPWCERADFPYIVHACNAYPRLVAELNRLCIEIPKQLGSNTPMTNAILRELGEDK